MSAKRSEREIHIAWTTVTYRSVATAVLILVCAVGLGFWIVAPETARRTVASAENWVGRLLDRIGSDSTNTARQAGQQQANFTNIEGTVRVKKANSNVWANAGYDVPLQKGDVVQTGPEGMAKVAFVDGTNYTIKPDSLIVIEENSTNAAQQTAVAVQVTTGTVDLATATFAHGSKSEVTVAGATASLAPDSAAMVHNDPRADQHEILVKRGASEVTRGSEVVHLGSYEKVSFTAEAPLMTKSKEMAPPTLIAPANMAPLFTSAPSENVTFNWTPMDNARGYHILVSRNAYFSSTVLDKRVPDAGFVAPLDQGAYYWMVRSVDDKGKESIDSEKNRFTLIAKGPDNLNLALELNQFVQHGHVIEISGRTAPSARVMVNGEEVPIVGSDGSFHYFTPPLPNGENVITITAQDTRGAVNTQQRKIVIQ